VASKGMHQLIEYKKKYSKGIFIYGL
jgi:hypothetical protein